MAWILVYRALRARGHRKSRCRVYLCISVDLCVSGRAIGARARVIFVRAQFRFRARTLSRSTRLGLEVVTVRSKGRSVEIGRCSKCMPIS